MVSEEQAAQGEPVGLAVESVAGRRIWAAQELRRGLSSPVRIHPEAAPEPLPAHSEPFAARSLDRMKAEIHFEHSRALDQLPTPARDTPASETTYTTTLTRLIQSCHE